MPIHNAEKTIERSLQSIISQTYEFWQLYCVLNCCTDNTEEVINNFFSKQPWNVKRPIMLECNIKGIVPALNTGLIRILSDDKNEWIVRADADDLLYPTKLEEQVEFVKKHPDTQIVGTQIRLVDGNGNPKSFQEPTRPLDDDSIKRQLLSGWNCMAHSTLMVHGNVFLQCGMYSNTFPYCEDYELWLKATLKHFSFANLSNILMDYTATNNNNSQYNPKTAEVLCYVSNIIHDNIK